MERINEGIKISFNNELSEYLKLSLYDISSGLQKSIRRGELNNALIYTEELLTAGQLNYLWKKIFTYLVEDIGMANLELSKILNKLYNSYKLSIKDNTYNDKFIYMAIFALCKSEKSREVDNFYCYIKKYDGVSDDIGDLEYINEYCKETIYNSKSKKLKETIKSEINFNFYNYINGNVLSDYLESMFNFWELNGDSGLNLYFCFFYLLKKYKDITGIKNFDEKNNEFSELLKIELSNYKFNIDFNNFQIQDYIFDMHTYKGKTLLGRGETHFFTEGALLNNRKIINNDKYEELLLKKLNINKK